ncbi:MAG TPA: polysaccharide deacetylase family protein [Methylomusa anaerophila]|uniref:Peptidoglycan-N-acetylglucosamine deacetylase n=1 Tax=Methylomusa anaerophila TaxID=1930071 RepID=A0A348AIA8_9FIRM|nr:polysaccharide deacetylase family protein [Methylomusa anaerophila]BBB90806.1 peptidoglycan-N-acetylglucosamine deacetylase [Methylomusa anaerophila]HML90537.1 polysaccharide deacetylase family protein [Methylomusa anaerophila]
MDMKAIWRRGFFSITVVVTGLLLGTALDVVKMLDDNATVIKKVPTTHKVVALSFDDGPHLKTTPEILAVLQEKNIKATFFVLGSNAANHPEIVAQASAAGHEIASHAFSHKRINSLSAEEIKQEIERTEAIITAVAPKPNLFRPPEGAYNDKIVALLREKGYTTILWSVDAGDWRRPPAGQVVKNVMDAIAPGTIILMHDGQPALPTAQALREIIDRLREQGYQIVTVGELLKYYEIRQ